MHKRPTVMGVINVSPESFHQASVARTPRALIRLAQSMKSEGADVIDIGAMSTAPYLKMQIPEHEESRRLALAIRAIKSQISMAISADTSRSRCAQSALDAGASIINDVTGLHGDPDMGRVARSAKCVILMAHPSALTAVKPRTPIDGVLHCLQSSLKRAHASGIAPSKLILDPGIGFFRDTRWPWWRWDIQVLQQLSKLQRFRLPILIGVSRKSFIGKILGLEKSQDRLAGSLAATLYAVEKGASWVRTHDVAATKQAIETNLILRKD